MRVGIGFDVHPFVKNGELVLGGETIPCQYGLQGHSDADVLTHSLMDAILGALGKGDIGRHFPDNEEKYRDINSLVLLEKVNNIMEKENYTINNVDIIIIAQVPRLSSYREKMEENLSKKLKCKNSKVNIKATTTEYLGFVGREEGIAAQAIVSINKN